MKSHSNESKIKGKGIGREMMRKMLKLLKSQRWKRASGTGGFLIETVEKGEIE